MVDPTQLASLSDRELLLLVAQQSQETHEALHGGHGVEGLIDRVTRIEERTKGVPTPVEKRTGVVGIIAAFISFAYLLGSEIVRNVSG